MKIVSVEAFPIRIPRALGAATGTAGSPTALTGVEGDYRWSEAYPALYSIHIETALVKLTTDTGLVGWGEAQAPLAPQVACAIIDRLLKPVLAGAEFVGSIAEIEALWFKMYSTMRVRGQTGGFMLDAISGVDLALWDLAGKIAGQPVACLLGAQGSPPVRIPAYVSGLPRVNRAEAARRFLDAGFDTFKIYYDADQRSLLESLDAFPQGASVAVDALWRLTPETAVEFGRALDDRGTLWLECPLPPEDPLAHGQLARAIRTPIALGESYRTCYELAPFFRERAMRYVQPDLGRSGITESLRIAREAAARDVAVVPHLSIALGPQIAAAIHFAAAAPNCRQLEYNPKVLEVANRFLSEPLEVRDGKYAVPQGPGLGIHLHENSAVSYALRRR